MHAAVDEGTKQGAVLRQILLVVTGLTPQVVTETIYALWRTDPALVPAEVHLVTTQRGAEHARLNLLSPSIDWIGRLRRDYQLPPIDFNAGHIHVIPGPDGAALEDIRTPEDNVRAADFITDLVRQLTADEDNALHVSIAGGRKSMGYFVGYALSLFGRPQDRLSHVLVSAPFENHRDFYYPTPTECPIHVPQGDKEVAHDCRNAKVDLAWIPFVRLRSAQHQPLLTGSAQFSACVSSVQEALAERELVIDLRRKRIRAGGQLIRVPQTELAFLSWFARRAQAGAPPLPGITSKDPEQRAEPYRDAYVAELRRIDPCLLRLIDYGRDAEGQARILETIADAVPSGQVSIDLTHGFRHLAAIGSLSAFFLERVRGLRVAGIYYGALDMTDQGETPVVRLDGLMTIERWLDALSRFDQNGDYGLFAPLLENDGAPADKVRCLVEAAFFERSLNLADARRRILTFLPVLDAPLNGVSGLFRAPLAERLAWVREAGLMDYQRRLARFYLRQNDFVRAAILGFEAVITRECGRRKVGHHDHQQDRKPAEEAFEADIRAGKQPRAVGEGYWMLKNLRNALAHGNPASLEHVRQIVANPQRLPLELEKAMDRVFELKVERGRVRES